MSSDVGQLTEAPAPKISLTDTSEPDLAMDSTPGVFQNESRAFLFRCYGFSSPTFCHGLL